MGKISEWYDRWSGRLSNTAALATIVPAGLVGVLSAWASSGVERIAEFGWFGALWAGLGAFLATSVALALLGRTRLWRVDARVRERLSGDSSPFDPMASTYEGKRLFLKDLAPAGRRYVVGKRFINCEIIGPGTAKLATRTNETKNWPVLDNNLMHDVDCIEVDAKLIPQNAIFFPDCSFQDCHFYSLTLMFDERNNRPDWNWITPDHRQAFLTDQNNAGPQ